MLTRFQKIQKGASIVEFALVAFFFFLAMWGIFEFGRAFYVRNTTQHLTRCIAREATVKDPTPAGALAAKQSCLLTSSSGFAFWPFYQRTPGDMTDIFQVRYCINACAAPDSDTDWVLEGDMDNSYLDQPNLCVDGDSKCVVFVQARVKQGEILDMYNLVKSWLGTNGDVNEYYAETTVPAESLGYIP